MADIRQTALIRDNFNRADEDPILPPWYQVDTSEPMARLVSNKFGPAGGIIQSRSAYWNVATFDNDDAEVWATVSDGAQAFNDGLRLGLLRDVGGTNAYDGYWLRLINTIASVNWRIEEVVNAAITPIELVVADWFQGDNILFRREGNDLVGYRSTDNYANWTEIIRKTDTTYMTGFYLALNTFGSIPTWDDFGGGARENRTQIYRWIKN